MTKKIAIKTMRMSLLSSGSKGNSAVIDSSTTTILIDVGISGKRAFESLQLRGIKPDNVKAIILTHEHIDHIRGVGPLIRKTGIPIYCTEETWKVSKNTIGKIPEVNFIETGKSFFINDFKILPFPIPHDAANPVGLTIEHEGKKIGFATDLGYPTKLIKERLKNCDVILIEFNYDRDLLIAGPYPWSTKQRIMSRRGHLSNDNAVELLEEIASQRLQHVVLAHLSENNNVPELAILNIKELFYKLGYSQVSFTTGEPNKPTDWIDI